MYKLPNELISDLRTDHAGETAAVSIYKTIILITKDSKLNSLARVHLASELLHLEGFQTILQGKKKSHILLFWRFSGVVIVIITALFGNRWIYGVISSIEDGVDRHYQSQLDKIENKPEYSKLYSFLKTCQTDEKRHRDEAAARCEKQGFFLKKWCQVLQLFSRMATAVTRII